MKKVLIAFLLLFAFPAVADDFASMPIYADGMVTMPGAQKDPDIIVFTVGGKTYYFKDLEKLVSDKNDMCINKITGGKVSKLYDILLSACQQSLAYIDDQIKKRGGQTPAWGAGVENAYLYLSSHMGSTKEALKGCLLDKEIWLAALKKTNARPTTVVSYAVAADIDACIRSIGEHWDAGTCPINPSVSDKSVIANITGVMNDLYRGKTFHFSLDKGQRITVWSYSQYVVFNGDVFVICNNNKAMQIVYPVYSGRLDCQDGMFQASQEIGPTPNGVYVVRYGDIDRVADRGGSLASWGRFRIPLIPADETQTYGRTNMYLHGTNDPKKEQSSGCISLGQSISDFVETTWNAKLGQKDLIIFVKIDQIQSIRKGNQ
ncbi:MAG: L,D-transpeptidase [Proteobacteria bacterium]|nr:L,D-transpeptidase [Pseudomonadota bacterium]